MLDRESSTKRSVLALVEAARCWGGQLFVLYRIKLCHPSRDGWGCENPRARILTCQNKSYVLLVPSVARSKYPVTNRFRTGTRCPRHLPRARAISRIFRRPRIAAARSIVFHASE